MSMYVHNDNRGTNAREHPKYSHLVHGYNLLFQLWSKKKKISQGDGDSHLLAIANILLRIEINASFTTPTNPTLHLPFSFHSHKPDLLNIQPNTSKLSHHRHGRLNLAGGKGTRRAPDGKYLPNPSKQVETKLIIHIYREQHPRNPQQARTQETQYHRRPQRHRRQ